MHTVGQELPRIDSMAKATGRAVYGADIFLPGMVYCKGVYAAYPHARILKIHTKKAERMPGVCTIITAKDIPGAKKIGEIVVDQYVLAEDKTRYLGDVIAVVAAESPQQAAEAAKYVYADYEELPVLSSPALAEGADYCLNADYPDNVCCNCYTHKGDVEEGFRNSDVIVQTSYDTQFVEHAYIEPEAIVAIPSRMRPELTILGSIQNPYMVRLSVSRTLNLPLARVLIQPSVIGGTFGGKLESVEPLAVRAGLIALRLGRPARYVLTREESIRESYKRHPISFKIKIGAAKDGKIQAVQGRAVGDGGAYVNMSQGVMWKTITLGAGPYHIDHVDYESKAVLTNNVHTGSMRGFGTPQAIFAMENAMDELAEKLRISPMELRRKNFLKTGDTSITGQVMNFHTVSIASVMEKVAKELEFDDKFARYNVENKKHGSKRRGVGIACSLRGVSIGAEALDVGRVYIEVEADASVHVNCGLTEQGQGLRTCLAQIAAEAVGTAFERITMSETDTGKSPLTGAAIASRGTFIGGSAILDAAKTIHSILAEGVGRIYGKSVENIVFENEKVTFSDQTISFADAVVAAYNCGLTPAAVGTFVMPKIAWDEKNGFGEAFRSYTYSSHGAEVEVDMDTGEVQVIRMVGCHDMGRAINPSMAKGQIYGGMVMGMGMALMEDLAVNPKTTEIKHLNFEEYLIPTALDIGENVSLLDEHPDPRAPFGGRSLGEPATEPGAAAVICALNHALGKAGTIKKLPADLDSVFAAVRASEKEEGR
ncbi:MAG: xanthine dehydrogenase family protein molybdopterin-binding subunit [Clostridia bacterium]